MPSVDVEQWCFPGDVIDFLRDLKANNERDWFVANKKRYEKSMKKSAAEFAPLMAIELGRLTGREINCKVFRINRDLRFSKDKTPYNPHLHMSFTPSDADGNAAYMFGLDTEKLTLGAGVFAFQGTALERFRQRVIGKDGDLLCDIMEKLRFDGARFSEPELKRVPSGYDVDDRKGDLLRHKGIAVWMDGEDPSVVTRPGVVLHCTEQFGRLKPLVDWING